MSIEPLASVDDYISSYGEPADTDRLQALLLRATGYLLGKLDGYEAGDDPVLDLNLSTVCCSMVNRALSVPEDMGGVSQYSQTAGSYSASVSLLDQYMRPLPSELDLLGLSDGAVFSCRMAGGERDADDV